MQGHTAVRTSRGRPAALVAGAALWAFLAAAMPAQQTPRPDGWTERTHGSRARPDYRRLFALDRVHELRITIPAGRFQAMQDDLSTITPGRGAGPVPAPAVPPSRGGAAAPSSQVPAAPPGRLPESLIQLLPGFSARNDDCAGCPPPDVQPPRAAPGRAIALTVRDPIYVPVTVEHDGRVWTHVGMRYKGNSSLAGAIRAQNGKLPFRLDFDRYEDERPEIADQRFYGFSELTFSSNYNDDSQLREVLAAEIFRNRGVPAPRAAFYRVFVDGGDGPEYWGLYTMIEDPSDTAMLKAQLGGDGGNLYKPDGPGANWTAFYEDGFPKKTNEEAPDFSDISGAIEALHADQPDPAAWRASLERRFDVDGYLRWLAVNTAILNWDAYGTMAHNYYLYGDPSRDGQLRWVPWDNNYAFGGSGARGGRGRAGGAPNVIVLRRGPPGPGRGADPLHVQTTDAWPLIKFLLADAAYATRYRAHLKHALEGLFDEKTFAKRARALHAMIAPSIVGETGERASHTTISSRAAFEASVDGPDGLIEFVRSRHEIIRTALSSP